MTLREQIHGWMKGREDEFCAALAPLISVDSTTGTPAPGMPFGAGPDEALRKTLALAESWGFRTDCDDGYVGMVDLNGQPDGLHILAHLDIVGIGDGWTTNPFELVRHGDLIYGRGTDDDKGPAIAALLAMRCVKELELPVSRNVRLILGTDEESGSADVAHYYSGHPFAPYAVTPDSTFPVTNCEKARYAPKFSRVWDPQKTAGARLIKLSGGIRVNVAPANCEAKILDINADEVRDAAERVANRTGVDFHVAVTQDGILITANGLQAHAAHPETGRNAITAMLEVLASLPLAQDAAFDTVNKLHTLFPYGDHEARALGIAMEDSISGKLSLTLSLLDLDENGFQAQFDSRDPLCATRENVKDKVEAILAAQGWKCDGEFTESHYVDCNSDFIRTLISTYEEFSEKTGYCESTGGGTYVHHIPGGVAFGAGEHDFDSHLHSANERASLKQLLLTAEIYAAIIARLCK